jgi:hypothetical protein
MALHSKWSSGHLIFYDGTNDIFEIKNGTDGVEFHQAVTYPDPTTSTSSGTITLTSTSNRIQFLSSTAARTVILPASSGVPGAEFKIFNVSSSGYDYTIVQTGSTGTTLAVVGQGEGGIFVSDGSSGSDGWGTIVAGASTA